MSGFVGIVCGDGAPVDRLLLQQMTRLMAFRGPDAQSTWADGSAGLGHALLRTTTESAAEPQPCSLDGQVWIAGDARIDGRRELLDKLGGDPRRFAVGSDAQLVLRAYAIWGDACVEHLLGDFAFAIWDRSRRELFCARDHFGVKPFYFAQAANALIVSNTLDVLRLHPGVSDKPNDDAVADFLLFGLNRDVATTSFIDIQRLPAGHVLRWSEGAPRVRRYWTLPVYDEVRYRRTQDYVDRFQELLTGAVRDRLTTAPVAIEMSGGLDSTTVAVTAHDIASAGAPSLDLRAHTVVYDRLIPDEERLYSGLVAERLGMPIRYFPGDDCQLYEHESRNAAYRTPEPVASCLLAAIRDSMQQVASHARVSLTGQGGDALLRGAATSYCVNLLKQGEWGRLLADMWWCAASGCPPRLDLYRRCTQALGRKSYKRGSRYPGWLNHGFAARLDLRERWRQANAEANRQQTASEPFRAQAYELLTGSFWPWRFERYDPGWTHLPLDVRHPLFDRRLVAFLLAIPPMPWCPNKALLRIAMRGKLPEPVRRRPKAPLAGNPAALLHRPSAANVFTFEPDARLAEYVDLSAFRATTSGKWIDDAGALWVNLRPRDLSYWLQGLDLGCRGRPGSDRHVIDR